MAPAEESAYFPSLQSCLDGTPKLLSWRAVAIELSRDPGRSIPHIVLRHIRDPSAIAAITSSLDPPTSSPKSRAEFESLTSAINVTPTSNGRYDINQIKEDALCLSRKTKVDEVAALRLTVLEWQSRHRERILQESIVDTMQNQSSNGLNGAFNASLLVSPASRAGANDSISDMDFDSTSSRRLRQLMTYISERQYLLQCAECLVARAISHIISIRLDNRPDTIRKAGGPEEVGLQVLKSWHLASGWEERSKTWFSRAISRLRSNFQRLGKQSDWSDGDDLAIDLEQDWSNANMLEIISLLKILLVVGNSSEVLAPCQLVLDWFNFMAEVGFADSIDIAFPGLSGAQLPYAQFLLALTSLSMVQLRLANASFPELSSSMAPPNEPGSSLSYLQNVQAMEEITQILTGAANASIEIAALPIFVWAIILQTIRDYASSSTEAKELRQSQRAIEGFGTPVPPSDNDSFDSETGRPKISQLRRHSYGSDTSQQTTLFEDIMELLQRLEPTDDLVALLANRTAEVSFRQINDLGMGFGFHLEVIPTGEFITAARSLLLDVVCAARDFVGYSESLVHSVLSIVLGSDDYWKRYTEPSVHETLVEQEARFLTRNPLLLEIFEEAQRRFPYESIPFVRIGRGLLSYKEFLNLQDEYLNRQLTATPSFTSEVKEPEVPYDLGGDGDHVSLRLAIDMDIMQMAFPLLRNISQRVQLPSSGQVPEGTTGRALTDSKPIVALWKYTYSALRLFGQVLQTTLELRAESQISTSHNLFELSTESIALMTTWIASVLKGRSTSETNSSSLDLAKKILEDASDGLSRNEDVIAIILDLLEGELYKQHLGNQEADSTGFIARGVQFLSVLATVFPGRVWSYLSRSGLLGLQGAESRLTTVVVAAELPTGEFTILTSSISLFEVLVEDAIANAPTKTSSSKAIQRFNQMDSEATGAGVPGITTRKILLQFTRILMDTFQSLGTWRFARVADKAEISSRICKVFDRILSVCFGTDDKTDLTSKLTGSLAPSAAYLSDTFLSQGPNDLSLKPLIIALVDGIQTPFDTTTTVLSALWLAKTSSSLNLLTSLLHLSIFLGRPSSQICTSVFSSMSVLAKLYVIHPDYCLPVVKLLEAAVLAAGTTTQPPSLLAHLGQSTARSFLDSLSTFGKPVERTELSVATWKFFSAVVSQRQQWLAVYLLTGRTPKETLINKDRESLASRKKPIVQNALASLSHLRDLQPAEASAMLEFIALAADHWEPVALELRSDQNCKEACLKYIADLQPPSAAKHPQSQANVYQYQIAASIVTILALLVHQSNEKRDTTTLRHIVPRLTYLIEHGVSTPAYNASLHYSLNKNFAAKFTNCSIATFKRTSFGQPSLGRNYYYDIQLAGKMLGDDAAWQARSNKGFAGEFVRANLNLSLVETQVKLFHSWKSLVLQLSDGLADDRSFQTTMATIIRDCLQANLDNTLPERFFERLAVSRADLAFTLLQRLTEVVPDSEDAKGLLEPAWALIQNQGDDIAALLVGENGPYNRTLLRLLYLALQPHASIDVSRTTKDHDNVERDRSDARAKRAKEVEATVLEILGSVVARGFRSLIVLLHDNTDKVDPADFVLLIAIMRTALHLPGVASHSDRLLMHFDDERTAQYAGTLLSWSDQLATGGDPIYGELSIAFLLGLSSVPALAESLAVNGTFSQLATTNLFNSFRRPGGIGPFDHPPRLYSIWARGFLPLVINLLSSIGPPIAAELSSTLSQFDAQLSRASHSLGAKLSPVAPGPHAGQISLAMAAEAHALALISSVLKKFRESGSSLGIVPSDIVDLPWDAAGVREDIETRLQRRNNLRHCIVPTDEHEEAWARLKPLAAQAGAENRLEEKVVAELTAALALLGSAEL